MKEDSLRSPCPWGYVSLAKLEVVSRGKLQELVPEIQTDFMVCARRMLEERRGHKEHDRPGQAWDKELRA